MTRQHASCQTGQKGRPLPANVFVFLVRLLIQLGIIAFGSVVRFLGGWFWFRLVFFFFLLKKLGWQFAFCYPACLSSSQPGQDPKSGHMQQSLTVEFSQP